MHRHLGGQYPYAAFFWPALAAVSAAETASSIAAQFLGFDVDGDRTAQEPEGATPGKIALELHTVRLRDFTVVKSGVPILLCTPLALHGAAVVLSEAKAQNASYRVPFDCRFNNVIKSSAISSR